MYTDCKQSARILYIFWTGMKCQNLSFRPIGVSVANGKGSAITIGNTIGTTFTNGNTATNTIGNTATNTITITNSIAIGNGNGTPRREYLWGAQAI